jgi:ribosomal protein S18 acetylase RimI-like enzyme
MPEELTIREVKHGSLEYQATVDLRFRILRRPLGLSFTDAELAGEHDSHHVACYSGKGLVGCLVLLPRSAEEIQMRQLAVEPGCQKQGFGKLLVKHSEKLARELGYPRMILHARETAVTFYENLGYTKVGERFIEVTLPHWKMIKSLAS